MGMDKETIKRIADLAALAINEDDLEEYARDLNDIIGCMEQISMLDTGYYKPMEHVLPLKNVLREDVTPNDNNRTVLIKSAPVVESGYYKVPSVVETI